MVVNAYSHLQKQPKHNNYILDDIKKLGYKVSTTI